MSQYSFDTDVLMRGTIALMVSGNEKSFPSLGKRPQKDLEEFPASRDFFFKKIDRKLLWTVKQEWGKVKQKLKWFSRELYKYYSDERELEKILGRFPKNALL